MLAEDALPKIIERCESKNYIFNGFVGEWVGVRSYLRLICIEHSYAWNINYRCFIEKARGCPFCGGSKKIGKDILTKRLDEACKSNDIEFEGFVNNNEIFNTKSQVKLFCKKHNFNWISDYSRVVYTRCKCPICSGKHEWTEEEARNNVIKKAEELGYKFVGWNERYSGASYTKLILYSPEYDYTWNTTSYQSFVYGSIGCGRYKRSKYEQRIFNILKQKNVKFETNYTGFKWLTNPRTGKRLEIDFYLLDFNTGIELQGQQHFMPVYHWAGQAGFEKIKKNDAVKESLCKTNNFNLLYINFNDDIEEKVLQLLELLQE